MSMDTASEPSNAPLSVNQAAALFGAEPEQPPTEAKAEEPAKVDPEKAPEATQAETDDKPVEEASAADETITIEVDGKTVEIKRSELPELYKGNLRQADYTRKTMETADQRKAAEAESAKAREERNKYAQGLQQAQSLLQAQLHEQSQIDWQKLLETDPVEYMKQDRIARERQAKLQHIQQEQQQLYATHQEEQAKAVQAHIQQQQEELLAKLPEWKDAAKAKAEKSAIKDYLKSQGLEDAQIDNITDHRVVILARKAMLHDQMIEKARAATKKVDNLPKMEKPGGGETNPTDGRTAAMKRLGQEKSVRAAADVFSRMF